jgi:hypothetical protein
MSFDYIEKTYGRKFHKGQEVMALNEMGIVVKADHHVHVKLHRLKHANPYHPNDVRPVGLDK